MSVEVICCAAGRGLDVAPLLVHLLNEHQDDIPPSLFDPLKAAIDTAVASVVALVEEWTQE